MDLPGFKTCAPPFKEACRRVFAFFRSLKRLLRTEISPELGLEESTVKSPEVGVGREDSILVAKDERVNCPDGVGEMKDVCG